MTLETGAARPDRRPRGKDAGALLPQGIAVLVKGRQVVQDPEGTPLSRHDEILFLHGQVRDRDDRQVLLERLEKKRVPRAELEKTIAEALDGHLCRCTGYIKYHEAVRDLILADPKRYLV